MQFNKKLYSKLDLETKQAVNNIEQATFGYNLSDIYQADTLIEIITLTKNEHLIGYVTYKDNFTALDLYMLAIDPKWRNQNMATHLINQLNTDDIILEVQATNDIAIKFYEKNGFKQISVIKKYYQNKIDALVMYKEKHASN